MIAALVALALPLMPSAPARAADPVRDTEQAPAWMMKLSCDEIRKRQAADDHSGPSYDRVDLERASRDKKCGVRKLPKMTAAEKAKRCEVLDRDIATMMKKLPKNADERKGRANALAERRELECPGPLPKP